MLWMWFCLCVSSLITFIVEEGRGRTLIGGQSRCSHCAKSPQSPLCSFSVLMTPLHEKLGSSSMHASMYTQIWVGPTSLQEEDCLLRQSDNKQWRFIWRDYSIIIYCNSWFDLKWIYCRYSEYIVGTCLRTAGIGFYLCRCKQAAPVETTTTKNKATE